eukprot:scaffold72706_cov52-Attheya_sp.AAC.1
MAFATSHQAVPDTCPYAGAIITPLVPANKRPSYTLSLRRTQTQFNGNAVSVHSNLGDGLQGHLFLIIETAHSCKAEYIQYFS